MTKEEYLASIEAIENKAKSILKEKALLKEQYISQNAKCEINTKVGVYSSIGEYIGEACIIENRCHKDGTIYPILRKVNKDGSVSKDKFFTQKIIFTYENFILKDKKGNILYDYKLYV